jgi:hypothetical protein
MNYPLNFVFFPDRSFLPHEVKVLNREQRGLLYSRVFYDNNCCGFQYVVRAIE